MKKAAETKVTKYTPARGYFYLVEEDRDGYSAWFGMEGFGRMSFSIGMSKACTTKEGFLECLDFEEDKRYFWMDYGDDLEGLCKRGYAPAAIAFQAD